MKKEDILKMSREENQNKDFYEIEIENKAVKIGALGILLLTTIYFCLEIFINDNTNYGWYSIISLYCALVYGYKGIKIKKGFSIICSIIWMFTSIMFIYTTISNILR